MLGVFGGVSCRAGTAGRELPLQRRRAAGMAPLDTDLPALGFDHGTVDHFMGNGVREHQKQIRPADLFIHTGAHLSNNRFLLLPSIP